MPHGGKAVDVPFPQLLTIEPHLRVVVDAVEMQVGHAVFPLGRKVEVLAVPAAAVV